MTGPASSEIVFVDLHTKFESATQSSGYGVSADGSTVVGQYFKADSRQGFIYDIPTGIVLTIGDLSGGRVRSRANAVSADGKIVVGSSESADGTKLIKFDRDAGTLETFTGLPDDWTSSSAYSVSADGSTLAGWGSGKKFGGFVLDTTTSTVLLPPDLPGGSNQVFINSVSGDSAWAVGSSSGSKGNQAILYDVATQTTIAIGELNSNRSASSAEAISSDGFVVVGWINSPSGLEAMIYNRITHQMTDVGDLPATLVSSTLVATNHDGSVSVGTAGTTELGNEAIIYDAIHGLRTVRSIIQELGLGDQISGWSLREATAISDDGKTIVGTGSDASGINRAWLLVIPEPIMSFGFLALFLLYGSRRVPAS